MEKETSADERLNGFAAMKSSSSRAERVRMESLVSKMDASMLPRRERTEQENVDKEEQMLSKALLVDAREEQASLRAETTLRVDMMMRGLLLGVEKLQRGGC